MDYLKRKFSWREIGSSYRLMLAIVVMLGALSFFFGEKTPASNGFGWDGVIYGDLVRNIDHLISSDKLNSYYAHRSLPAVVVRTALQAFQIPMTDINIIKMFEVLNFLLFLIIFTTWKKITHHFNLSLREHWIGFCGLFLSFSMSKLVLYLPLNTDVPAACIGTLLLYFYLKKNPFLILLTTIIGAFCWPGVAVTGALLLFFMNFELSPKVIFPETTKQLIKDGAFKTLIKWGWMALIGAVILRVVFKLINPEWRIGAFLTGLPTIYFLGIGLLLLLGSWSFLPELWNLRSKVSFKLTALSAIALLLPSYLGKLISNPSLPNPNTPLQLLELIFFPPDNKFFLPPLTLALFWGPTFLLMIIFWKRIVFQLRKLGPAPMAIIALHLPLGLVCEPRFFTLIWPLLLISLLMALHEVEFKKHFRKLFIVLTIIFSKFWLIINWPGWEPDLYDNLLKFPKQLLFMNLGLWTSWPMYHAQLPLVILCWYYLRKSVVEIKN